MPVSRAIHNFIKNGRPTDDEKLLRPVQEILDQQKHLIWTQLTIAYNYWYNVNKSTVKEIIEILQSLSTSLEILNQIGDEDIEFKAEQITAANYVFYAILQRILSWEKTEAVEVFKRGMLRLFRSRGIEMHWKQTKKCPTTCEYYAVIEGSSLVPLLTELLAVFSVEKPDIKEVTSNIARYLRIRHDLLMTKFSIEGNFNYPLVYAVSHSMERQNILQILQRGVREKAMQNYYTRLLTKSGSLDATKANLELIYSRLRKTGNTYMESFMEQMHTSCEQDVNLENFKTNGVY